VAVDAFTLDELDLLGVRSSPNAYPAMVSLLASGAVRTDLLTADRYALGDIGAAFDALARRASIRPIVLPSK
jgi:threonine dehydrogenase-like Zn-dependent dehydrogenase